MPKYFIFCFLFFIASTVAAQEITASQKMPASIMPGMDFIVETTINKGSITSFMKFFQELPEGFVATDVDSKNGSFTFVDNGAKVVWLSPPAEAVFTVSYKVTVPKNASGPKKLPGKIFYISGNERKIVELEAKTIMIGNGSITPVKKDVAKTMNTPPSASAPVADKTIATKTNIPTPPPASKTTTVVQSASPGKIYKVQIGAYSSKPKMDGVPEVSTFVLDNGITKYFSGKFSVYEDAMKRKKEMEGKGFKNAFIVTFENGKIVK